MKRITTLLIILISTCLFAEINIEFSSGRTEDVIIEKNFENVPYFKLLELNKTFNASIEQNIIDNSVTIKVVDKKIEFCIESPYFKLDEEIYNMHQKLLLYKGNIYLPSSFIKRTLTVLLPENFLFNNGKVTFTSKQKTSLDIIVIDPGHGGKDPGAIGYSKKNYEKDIVLKISKLVKQKIEANSNVNVILTRSDDTYVDLHSRTKLANRKGAGLFVSIHCNANYSKRPNGVEVYFLSTAKTTEERAVQHLENSVVYEYEDKESLRNYSDLDLILFDMAQNEHLEASSQIALNMQDKLVITTGFRN
ncbi:MAG: N-acetylmuramoyl-L-alanine amidase, partial [Candidatus Cloacimonadota bacterium]|nr:N-acetylmuramoyl-L-alanine amidase [Candidatus Cloacimonadota bacterium]